MSKPVARIALFVLVSLVLIAATSVSVRGLLGGTDQVSGAQAHMVGGLKTNFNHDRSTVGELERLQLQADNSSYYQPGHGHGCRDEGMVSPDD